MLVNPRLTDAYGVLALQADLDFAIPFLREDIPLYVDPFLLWKSPSQQDQALHTSLINSFNGLGDLFRRDASKAAQSLVVASECDEVGLGTSASRKGKRIGLAKSSEILDLFKSIPQYHRSGFKHFEEMQFFVSGISKDRISDIACNFLKSFLIDFTMQQCKLVGLPLQSCKVEYVWDYRRLSFVSEDLQLPIDPETRKPIILVPKRWLRYTPWIDFDDFFINHCPQDNNSHKPETITRVNLVDFNRKNFDVIDEYIREKERTFEDCKNDPLFSAMPIISAKRKLGQIRKLATGIENEADAQYERLIGELLPSLLYPYLDFADVQSRSISGAVVRDLIFYNNQQDEFLAELFSSYGSRQIVFEMKNVKDVSRDHVSQLNRYMTDELGKFGVLVTRNVLTRARMQSTIDLWSGQRRCIIAITDDDVSQMVELFESKQRRALDVIKRRYVEYRRLCPS